MDAVRLVLGIRRSARAVQHVGPAGPPGGARRGLTTRLAVVDRLIVSFFLFLWPRRGRNPATVWGDVTVPHVRVNQTVLEPKSSAASACAQTGRCERCSGAMENACMQIATEHGAMWACVLAGFYSASSAGEVVLQRIASSASIPPKPPGAPLPDDAWCHAAPCATSSANWRAL